MYFFKDVEIILICLFDKILYFPQEKTVYKTTQIHTLNTRILLCISFMRFFWSKHTSNHHVCLEAKKGSSCWKEWCWIVVRRMVEFLMTNEGQGFWFEWMGWYHFWDEQSKQAHSRALVTSRTRRPSVHVTFTGIWN